jgi:hypothetical protein
MGLLKWATTINSPRADDFKRFVRQLEVEKFVVESKLRAD